MSQPSKLYAQLTIRAAEVMSDTMQLNDKEFAEFMHFIAASAIVSLVMNGHDETVKDLQRRINGTVEDLDKYEKEI